ncbi:MAG: hypothetical protein LBE92_10980 [Chryseobacterium sp.]|jgi:hypothetical protein|uniref:DUF6705 family protein n=1 Tax=Chryseobacterium sp. TaxID=1871047 RepID=UPI0028368909|nr:DUF6705 family protein [Chryseobacterium sp.]MDR2236638.1 hypothetical protein [Chryseobacterium sp.]
MKKIKIVAAFFILFISFLQCKAQQTYSLNTDEETVPDYSYLKDLNNELEPYIGTYKASYQGNEIILYITKVEHALKERTKKTYYMDALVVRYTVKNSSGIILQSTQNIPSNIKDFYSMGTMPQYNAVVLYYSGTNCGVGWGTVYFRKINSTQIYWDYHPNSSLLNEGDCPGNQDIKVYLPVTKDLIFTKQ